MASQLHSSVEYEGCTEVQVQKVTYLWTIKNFSFCKPFLNSPTFTTGAYKNLKWYMKVEQSPSNVALYLRFYSTAPHPYTTHSIEAKYKLCLLNAKGEKAYVKEIPYLEEFRSEQNVGFNKFIERAHLLNESNGLISKDEVKIFCELDVVVNTIETSGPSIVKKFMNCDCKLGTQFGNLFNNADFSDVTLVVGYCMLPAHKAILARNSEVFAAIFKQEMKDRITITDIKYEAAKEMLRFMYTRTLSNLDEMAGDLLAAADRYAVVDLKVICEKALCNQLSSDTAGDLLILANLHNAQLLKAKTLDFMCSNATEVMKTHGWRNTNIEHSDLIAKEILTSLTQKIVPIPGYLKKST